MIFGHFLVEIPKLLTKGLAKKAAEVGIGAASPKDKFDVHKELLKAQGDIRVAMVQGFAALVVAGGLYFTYRTLTATARLTVLQRYAEAAHLMAGSATEKAAGKLIIDALSKEPEAKDLKQGMQELPK